MLELETLKIVIHSPGSTLVSRVETPLIVTHYRTILLPWFRPDTQNYYTTRNNLCNIIQVWPASTQLVWTANQSSQTS